MYHSFKFLFIYVCIYFKCMHNEQATLAVDCVHIGISKTIYIDVGDFF